MTALVGLASLMHDLGKSTQAFQDMLSGKHIEKTQYRHEWLSLRLFESFVGGRADGAWLQDLVDQTYSSKDWTSALPNKGLLDMSAKPFKTFKQNNSELAAIVGWLILSHHRLPAPILDSGSTSYESHHLIDAFESITAAWNDAAPCALLSASTQYETFNTRLPVDTPEWRAQAGVHAAALMKDFGTSSAVKTSNMYLMHVSRMTLMLADHHYSSLNECDDLRRVLIEHPTPLYANTKHSGAIRVPNQSLDEHLVGVALAGERIAAQLPNMRHSLRGLTNAKLQGRTLSPKFAWQDTARDACESMHAASERQGAFIINLASTGYGKTLGNAKMIDGLNAGENVRCSIAMGLRTLTLQTGRALRDGLGLKPDEMAIMVGGNAKALADYHASIAEKTGSSSSMALSSDDLFVEHEANEKDTFVYHTQLSSPKTQSLVEAPFLVCTIDHLTPATESLRGGRQIGPMLRLMTSDVILDEPDDFDINDLPALTRLVHFTGLLGGRLVLSSATLPPALVHGLYLAYTAGRSCFNQNMGWSNGPVKRFVRANGCFRYAGANLARSSDKTSHTARSERSAFG